MAEVPIEFRHRDTAVMPLAKTNTPVVTIARQILCSGMHQMH